MTFTYEYESNSNDTIISKATWSGHANIPSNVTSIGNFAFYLCSGLTSITFPKGLISIGCFEFSCCENLVSLTCQGVLPSIDRYAFHRVPGSQGIKKQIRNNKIKKCI
jgi:hypothetical protein